jgi:hypothetical protein
VEHQEQCVYTLLHKVKIDLILFPFARRLYHKNEVRSTGIIFVLVLCRTGKPNSIIPCTGGGSGSDGMIPRTGGSRDGISGGCSDGMSHWDIWIVRTKDIFLSGPEEYQEFVIVPVNALERKLFALGWVIKNNLALSGSKIFTLSQSKQNCN